MYKFLAYWMAYTILMLIVAVALHKVAGIDADSMAENAPVVAGIMALAITRKSED